MEARTKEIIEKIRRLRKEIWPDVSPELLWHRKRSDGYSTIPRTLALVMVIMDTLTKGKPVSSTYLELWCRTFDESFLMLSGKEAEYARASGFSGERMINTWTSRLDLLEELGFIRIAPGPSGERSYVLILNPYHVMKKLKPRVERGLWLSFVQRAMDIKATEMMEAKASDPPGHAKNRPKGK